MSDEPISGSEDAAKDAETAPKTRRISNKNPRKTAKVAKTPKAKKVASKAIEPEMAVPVEEFDSTPPSSGDSEQDTTSGDSQDPKRKNRRRRGGKGKGNSDDRRHDSEHENNQDSSEDHAERQQSADSDSHSDHRDDKHQQRHQDQKQRPKKQRQRLDPDKVAKKAWKIYLAEVSEEGVALIGDNDARELSRRCFRLAEHFLEEQQRRN